jgi:hypothetical protein
MSRVLISLLFALTLGLASNGSAFAMRRSDNVDHLRPVLPEGRLIQATEDEADEFFDEGHRRGYRCSYVGNGVSGDGFRADVIWFYRN